MLEEKWKEQLMWAEQKKREEKEQKEREEALKRQKEKEWNFTYEKQAQDKPWAWPFEPANQFSKPRETASKPKPVSKPLKT